ncbi:MAG: group II intron reverse transcriptase/maturase [Saprospiraceae bacterium]
MKIPKPSGGVRQLGIPTVMDRLVQQSIHQVLSPVWEKEFSVFSYGFRPKRSAQDALQQALEYINSGRQWVIDLDLKSFFDRVDHDKLMNLISRKVADKTLLRLVRRYLKSGIMEGGLVQPRTEGTPQGGPLSPLLSNILLNELDRELEKRGHKFVRYADDCSIFLKSKRAAERVLASIRRFLEEKLHLEVNREKTKIVRPVNFTLLGHGFVPTYKKGERGRYQLSIAREKLGTAQRENQGNHPQDHAENGAGAHRRTEPPHEGLGQLLQTCHRLPEVQGLGRLGALYCATVSGSNGNGPGAGCGPSCKWAWRRAGRGVLPTPAWEAGPSPAARLWAQR